MGIMIKGKLKKWGNSFGVIIPKEIVDNEGFNENQEVEFLVVKNDSKKVLKETFGILKRKGNKSTEQIMREMDKELYPEDYE